MTVKLGPDHLVTLQTQTKLVEVYLEAKKDVAAETIASRAQERWQRRIQGLSNLGQIEREQKDLANLQSLFGECLVRQRKFAEAEPVLQAALAVRDRKDPEAWTTFHTRSLLGDALLGQKKYAGAEPLLLAGYKGMKQRADRRDQPGGSPPTVRLTEALERLVRLSEATGKPDEAARWRKELATIQSATPPAGNEKQP
jgi:hypothetical protein